MIYQSKFFYHVYISFNSSKINFIYFNKNYFHSHHSKNPTPKNMFRKSKLSINYNFFIKLIKSYLSLFWLNMKKGDTILWKKKVDFIWMNKYLDKTKRRRHSVFSQIIENLTTKYNHNLLYLYIYSTILLK